MQWEVENGHEIRVWSISYRGYGKGGSMGSSMTDWGHLYTLDKLLNIRNIESFQKDLPPKINSFAELLEILIDEINKTKKEFGDSPEVLLAEKRIPAILQHIRTVKGR